MQNLNLSWTNVIALGGAVVMIARVLVKVLPDPKVDSYLEEFIDLLKHLGLAVDPVSDAQIPVADPAPTAPVVAAPAVAATPAK